MEIRICCSPCIYNSDSNYIVYDYNYRCCLVCFVTVSELESTHSCYLC